jgi:hypothetical protein
MNCDLSDCLVRKIPCKEAKQYIHQNHYSKGSHNGPSPCYGMFWGKDLIGCLMFATPCSENVRASLFGSEHKSRVVELHRLHIMDCTPKNAESWFISRCLKMLKHDRPQTWGVISFADTTEGHQGIIYQASNFIDAGSTGKAWFYIDEHGRLRHPRQNGVNISKQEAESMGWTRVPRDGKRRYIYLLNKQARRLYFEQHDGGTAL